jgi:hypothetical protein
MLFTRIISRQLRRRQHYPLPQHNQREDLSLHSPNKGVVVLRLANNSKV